MILNSLNNEDQKLIKLLCDRFKHKYPNSYHESEDLQGECYLKYDYIKNQYNDKKGSWKSFLQACLWNELNRICLSTSSPLTLKKHTCKKLLKTQNPVLSRRDINNNIKDKNISSDFFLDLDLSQEELETINKISYSSRGNAIFKRKNKDLIKKIKEKLNNVS